VVQRYLTWSTEHPSSLYSAVRGARENARTVRDVMSLEAWEAINDLWLWLGGRDSERLYQRNRSAFYERLMQATVLFHGLAHATMLHGEPFSFMKLGRAVERTAQTTRILHSHLGHAPVAAGAADASRWLTVLRCCCAFDPFFRGALHSLSAEDVMRFLLFERSFPRSVLCSLDEARSLLFALRRNDPIGLPRRSRAALERLRGELLQMDVADVRRRGLAATLRWIEAATDHLCDAVHDDYLDPPMAWLRHCVRVLESLESSPDTALRECAA